MDNHYPDREPIESSIDRIIAESRLYESLECYRRREIERLQNEYNTALQNRHNTQSQSIIYNPYFASYDHSYAEQDEEISKGMTLDEWQKWTDSLIKEVQDES